MAATIDEADVCGICLETLPPWGQHFTRLTCCGKGMHKACVEELHAHAHPVLGSDKCPMCRAPVTSALGNHRRALKWAERGKAWAMHTIAQDYQNGRGVQKSHKTARLWYGRAAERGDAEAQSNLALMHTNGLGGSVSMEQARVWHGKAEHVTALPTAAKEAPDQARAPPAKPPTATRTPRPLWAAAQTAAEKEAG